MLWEEEGAGLSGVSVVYEGLTSGETKSSATFIQLQRFLTYNTEVVCVCERQVTERQ